MDGYSFYKVFLPIHLHFTSSYDCVKYGGKSKNSEDAYNKRRDKHLFEMLSQRYPGTKSAAQFCVANCVRFKDFWLAENPQVLKQNYEKRMAFLRNPAGSFKEELTTVRNTFPDKSFFDLLKGKMAPMLQLYTKGIVTPELVVCVDKVVPLIESCEDFLFNENGTKLRLTKLHPFVDLDKTLSKEIIKSVFQEQ